MRAAWRKAVTGNSNTRVRDIIANRGRQLFFAANLAGAEDQDRAETKVKIAIQTLDGQTWDFSVSLRDNVAALKQMIATREGVALNTQKLYLEADELKEHKRLGDYNLQKGDTLMLIIDDPPFHKFARGQRVRHKGTVAYVQYVINAYMMDLCVVEKSRRVTSVRYGIHPAEVELLEATKPYWWPEQ
jgi:hypothetical protein